MQSLNLPALSLQFPSSGSLEAYLQYTNAIPVLTREEEYSLAVKWYDSGDLHAVQTLVLSHLRYVVRIAKNYMGYGLDLADLMQEGTIGLMKAVKKFEPSRELRLITFAMHWIKAEIHEFILRNWRMVKIATTKAQRKLFFRLRSLKTSLQWLSDKEIKVIADDLGVKPSDVTHMESRLYSNDLSFDLPVDDDVESNSLAPIDYIVADNSFNPENALSATESIVDSKDQITSALQVLDQRERFIIESRWLHDGKPKATLNVLAKKFNISEERVRQLEKKAISTMRNALGNALALTDSV